MTPTPDTLDERLKKAEAKYVDLGWESESAVSRALVDARRRIAELEAAQKPAPQPPPTVTEAEVEEAARAMADISYGEWEGLLKSYQDAARVEARAALEAAARVRAERAQAEPDDDAAQYARGALQAVLAAPDFDTAKCFAQAGLDLVTLGADACAEMRGDKAQAAGEPDKAGTEGGTVVVPVPPIPSSGEKPSDDRLSEIWREGRANLSPSIDMPMKSYDVAGRRALYDAGFAAGRSEADRRVSILTTEALRLLRGARLYIPGDLHEEITSFLQAAPAPPTHEEKS